MSRYRPFIVREWAGLNEDENPDAIAQDELSVAQNVWKHGKAIGTRPGLERDTDYDATISTGAAGDCVHGLTYFPRSFDSADSIVAVCGGLVHTDDATALTKDAAVTISDPGAGTGNAGKNLWTFAIHKNLLYAAGGADGDTPWVWDPAGSTVNEVVFQNAGSSDIDAKFIFEKWNFLFLNGMNGTAVEDNPTIGRYSAINDGATWPIGNSFGGTSAIGGISSFGDEYTTGWGDYTDNRGDWLLMLTNRQIYPVEFTGSGANPFRVASGVANGCVSQRAFVSLGIDSGDAVYLSNQGIHSVRQSQAHGGAHETFLSWKIRPTFARINQSRIRQSVGAYWPEEGVALFAVPTGSNTANDTILCLDLKATQGQELNAQTARWYVWNLNGFNANVMTVARDATSKKRYLYIGDCAGNVLRFNRDIFSDLTASYTTRFVTKHNDFDAPGVSKGLGDIWVGLQPSGTHTPNLRFIFDYGRKISTPRALRMNAPGSLWGSGLFGTATFGSDNPTGRRKVFGTGQGDTIAFEFSHAGSTEPFRVTTFMAQIRGAGETLGTQDS